MNDLIYLSLGSNQGDSQENLLQALLGLGEKGFSFFRISGIYQTEPWGVQAQPDFLNMVVSGRTAQSPQEMLASCLALEKELGRVREEHWGPRVLDIDLLFWGEQKIKTLNLQIPHPRIAERAFVLIPLREIAPRFFEQLNLPLPIQKVELFSTASCVKLILQKRGLFIPES